MKPIWKNNCLVVELHKPDVAILTKALAIGAALTAMAQPTGPPLVDAVAAILKPEKEE